ncbi:eukaryotic cytochrome b561 domain-containing protein [Phthorimaea operculella]|nr:eukaryotic cytochrome b561 domain-containing protein [Phthorimaea operculella]
MSQPTSGWVVCLSLVNSVTHILIGAIACVAFLFANRFDASSFNQHIYLCVTGYIILMSQAIMSLGNYGWTSTVKYNDKKIIHLSMQIIGSVLAIAGSIHRMIGVNSHFQSAHGAFGIFAFVFTCLSLIGGVITHFTDFKPRLIKICHTCFGCVTITCAFLCFIFALDKSIFRLFVLNPSANMLIFFTVMALIGTLLPACMNLYRRLSN